MTRRMLGLAVLVLAGGMPLTVRAQKTEAPAKPATVTDAQFVMQASATDLAEVNLGRIAARQATNPDVKQFAQRMVNDHSKSSTEMLALVNKKQGLPVAARMDQKHRALSDRLLQLRGADFDREYMTHMVEGHRQAVALFEAESANGKEADVKAFAAKHLPTIREHFKMAQDIANKLKGGK